MHEILVWLVHQERCMPFRRATTQQKHHYLLLCARRNRRATRDWNIWGKCSAACLQHDRFGGSVIFWKGMASEGRTVLHIPARCTLAVVMWAEILRPTGRPYAGAVGTGFLRCKTILGVTYLRCVISFWMTTALMPLSSPPSPHNLYTIKHLWTSCTIAHTTIVLQCKLSRT